MNSCISRVLTARIISPPFAPATTKYRFTDTKNNVRRKISLFTVKKDFIADDSKMHDNDTRELPSEGLSLLFLRKKKHPMKKPAHCAISVPDATPSIFIPRQYTNNRDTSMFTTFCVMEMIIGIFVFCIPTNHPFKAKRPRLAGAPQMQI